MPYHFLEVAVTPSVRAAQADMGVDQIWLGDPDRPSDTLTENEIAYIGTRDSFYIASVSETGWPYVQHRGGKAGFLKVVDSQTLHSPTIVEIDSTLAQGILQPTIEPAFSLWTTSDGLGLRSMPTLSG